MRKGQTTYYEYDAAGKLRQSVLVDVVNGNATNLLGTSYGYDEKSRLTDAFYGFDYYAPGGYKAEDLYYHYQYHDDDKLQSMRFETTDRRVTGNIVPTYDNLGRTASRVSFFRVNGANAFYREEGFSYNTYYDAEYRLVCQSAQVSEYTSGIAVSGTAALVFPVTILGALWSFGLDGVWFNFVGVNALAAILGAVLLLRIRREIRRREAKKAEKTALG